uniref:Uncharacterized protein n=1 Tax=Lepeophtheirus salmonis TaxID=72036 RepID=A0A0K2SV61_LEPSM
MHPKGVVQGVRMGFFHSCCTDLDHPV